jgi:G6PDH family F420-dependent oxidoreductase
MVQIGYALSSEEHAPNKLVANAKQAEDLGFSFALISDHFHPWTNQQGHSPFVWSVIGAIALATDRIQLGTGVTCPTTRIHPAIIAQAAATSAAMMPGRFFLGLGTGEALNEHILGDRWPAYEIRIAMFEEAVDLIRTLWTGKKITYPGAYYIVENARIYTLPDELPPIMIAASGAESARLAGELGDGFISTAPKKELVQNFASAKEDKRPRYGMLTVCCDEDEQQARETALKWWPTSALHGELGQILPTPEHFEQAVKNVTEDDVAQAILCGNDVQQHREKIQAFIDAGFDHVYIHQVGPDQTAFFDFYERSILPHFQKATVS